MAERNDSHEWVRVLSQESERWVREGRINEAQRREILSLYPHGIDGGRDRTVLIISILGSLLVGVGIILFYAANWQSISSTVKVGSLMVAVVGTYVAGYYLQYGSAGYPRIGHSLIFLASLFYGAAIWLIAQIFHLEAHYPDGFLMWAVGVLPIAWVTASQPILYLATVLLGIWTIMEQTNFGSFNYLFPVVLVAVLIPLARRLRTSLAEAGALAGLFLWFALNVANNDSHSANGNELLLVARVIIPYGAVLMVIGLSRLGEERAYLGIGSLAALFGTYLLSFGDIRSSVVGASTLSPYLTSGVALMLAGFVGVGWRYWKQAGTERYFVLSTLLTLLAADGATYWMGDITRAILFNLLLFGGTVSLILFGIQRRVELLINLGLGVFVVHVLTRYVDFFFKALDKSLFFMLGGILLLGGGWLLERNRRRWIQMSGGDGHDQ